MNNNKLKPGDLLKLPHRNYVAVVTEISDDSKIWYSYFDDKSSSVDWCYPQYAITEKATPQEFNAQIDRTIKYLESLKIKEQ